MPGIEIQRFKVVVAGFCLLIAAGVGAETPEPAAETRFVRGDVLARTSNEAARELKTGSPVYLHDHVETGVRSFAVLAFANQDRFTIRPLTRVRIEAGGARETRTGPALFLEQGAVRARFGGGGGSVRTGAGELATDDGEITVRWCEADCAGESAAGARPVAGKALVLHGQVTIQATDETPRALAAGGRLYPGDRIETGPDAYALLVFRDGSRIALNADSALSVEEFQYLPGDPKQNQVRIRLDRGSGRFKTGAVGKTNPSSYRVFTPVVMTGIRGTGFDLVCVGNCGQGDSAVDDPNNGLYTYVWEGAVTQTSDAGTFELGEGASSFVAGARRPPVRIQRLPEHLAPSAPRPDQLAVDPEYLFQMNVESRPPSGLYVRVHSGSVALTTKSGEVVRVNEGRTGYVDPQGVQVLESGAAPGFMGDSSNCQ